MSILSWLGMRLIKGGRGIETVLFVVDDAGEVVAEGVEGVCAEELGVFEFYFLFDR